MVDNPVVAHIVRGSHVTLHYRIAVEIDGAEREVVSTFGDRPATLTVGAGALAPPLEERLVGLAEGARARFELAPGEGFGPRNPALVQSVSAGLLREHAAAESDPAPGEVVHFRSPDGHAVAGVLKRREGERALVDFNHPLAGMPVRFDVHVVGVL
jgi:FKBP-type peptidyl-prolyl cis-trans isomerase SlpA